MSVPRHRYNWPLLFAVLIDILLLALLSHTLTSAGTGLAVLLLVVVTPKIPVDKIGQVILGLFALVAAYGVITLQTAEVGAVNGGLGPLGTLFALAFLFNALVRLAQKRAFGGDPVTAGLLFLSVLSMGSVASGRIYPAGSVVMLLLLTLACRYRDPIRPSVTRFGRRNTTTLGIMLLIFAAIFTGLILGLPFAYNQAFKLIEARYNAPQTGFSFSMGLSDLDGMLQSDRLVMRIFGPKPDYLRGMVYTRYVRGRWLGGRSDTRQTMRTAEPGEQAGQTDIRMIGGERDRYFLPLAATRIRVQGGVGVLDSGVLYPKQTPAIRVTFDIKKNRSGDRTPPTEEALAIPATVATDIRTVARDWSLDVAAEAGVKPVMRQILKRLQDFDYSLEVALPPGSDPVTAFLTTTRKGHCEYFASAAALLARAQGIPSRVVGGYRVHEYNALGDYYMVREQNAHAWIEVFAARDGWITVDPTPGGETAGAGRTKTPLLGALFDVAARYLWQGVDRLSALTVTDVLVIIACLVAVWGFLRLLRRFRRRPRISASRIHGYRDPPPEVVRFLERLRRHGISMQPGETIEGFAKRLSGLERTAFDAAGAARILSRYVVWRFGDRGELAALKRDFSQWEN